MVNATLPPDESFIAFKNQLWEEFIPSKNVNLAKDNWGKFW